MSHSISLFCAYLLAVLLAGTFFYFVIAHKIGFKYSKKLFGTRRIKRQGQDIPLEGNLFAAAYIRKNQARILDEKVAATLPGAFLLRWVLEGKAEIVRQTPLRGETVTFLSLHKEASFRDRAEETLFRKYLEAADEKGLLYVDVVYQWAYHHPRIEIYGCDPEKHGLAWFEERDMIDQKKSSGPLTKVGALVPRLTAEGAREARKVVELQNFLQAVIEGKADAPVPEDRMNELLVYALLFEIDEKMVEAWKERLSEETPDVVKLCKDMGDGIYMGALMSEAD